MGPPRGGRALHEPREKDEDVQYTRHACTVTVAAANQWIRGSFNLYIPVEVEIPPGVEGGSSSRQKLLLRSPFPSGAALRYPHPAPIRLWLSGTAEHGQVRVSSRLPLYLFAALSSMPRLLLLRRRLCCRANLAIRRVPSPRTNLSVPSTRRSRHPAGPTATCRWSIYCWSTGTLIRARCSLTRGASSDKSRTRTG